MRGPSEYATGHASWFHSALLTSYTHTHLHFTLKHSGKEKEARSEGYVFVATDLGKLQSSFVASCITLFSFAIVNYLRLFAFQ
jgi:hypothetical protein